MFVMSKVISKSQFQKLTCVFNSYTYLYLPKIMLITFKIICIKQFLSNLIIILPVKVFGT